MTLWNRIKRRYGLWKRSIRFWWQRRTRGWDDRETWNLDISLSEMIVPRLKRFKEVTDCYMGENPGEWAANIDKMIRAFELCRDQFELANGHCIHTKEEQAQIAEGLGLFARYYQALWW